MAEENIGGFSVGLDKESINLIREVVESSRSISEHLQKAGVDSELLSDHIQKMDSSQKAIVENMRLYSMISLSVLENIKSLNDSTKNSLDTHKAITDQMKSQTSEIEKQKELEAKKQEEMLKRAENDSKQVARAITNPLDYLGNKITSTFNKIKPGLGLIVGVAAMEMSRSVSELRDITRTGGEGLGALGISGAIGTNMAIRTASMRVPFLKESYGSKAEMQQGAGLMFGTGGIRGSDLTTMMQDLPKLAYEAGVSFGDASKAMSKLNRVLDTTANSLLSDFKMMSESAREAGENISDWVKFVTDTTTKTAKYGSTMGQINNIAKKLNDIIRKELISREDLQKVIVEGYRNRIGENRIIEKVSEAYEVAQEYTIGAASQIKLRSEVEKTLISYMKDSTEAHENTSGVLTYYADSVERGARNADLLRSALGELVPIFGKSQKGIEGIVSFVDSLEGFSKAFGYNSEMITKGAIDFSKTLFQLTGDQTNAFEGGAAVAKALAKELHEMEISVSEVNGLLQSMSENFGMLPSQIVSNIKHLKDLGDAFDVSTPTVLKWQQGMSDGMREMFTSPQSALKVANQALVATIPLLKEGKVTVGDYTKVMRSQMDVFGKSGEDAAIQFNTLAQIVGKTSVRMSELATQTEQLSKLNRQYGINQDATNALLYTFNRGLRQGSASMQDLEAVISGTRGGSTAVSGMAVQRLSNMGGPIGEMFQNAGVLGGMDVLLPDMIRWSSGQEEATPALRRALGRVTGNTNMSFREFTETMGGRENVAKQLGTMMTGIIDNLVPEGASEEERMAIFKRMTPEILGKQVTAYGRELESIYRIGTGEIDFESMKKAMPELGDVNEPAKRTASNTDAIRRDIEIVKNVMVSAGYSHGYESDKHGLATADRRFRPSIKGSSPRVDVSNSWFSNSWFSRLFD